MKTEYRIQFARHILSENRHLSRSTWILRMHALHHSPRAHSHYCSPENDFKFWKLAATTLIFERPNEKD